MASQEGNISTSRQITREERRNERLPSFHECMIEHLRDEIWATQTQIKILEERLQRLVDLNHTYTRDNGELIIKDI